MRPTIAVIIAGAALGLTPAAAQNADDNAMTNETTATAPDANAAAPVDNMAAVPPFDANAAMPPETAPVETQAPQPAPMSSGALPWGLLGLLGLVGLFGRKRSS